MSEYQYYEFRALDRSLTPAQMRALRRVSSRGEITKTSFANTYDFGDFHGDPAGWVDRYFDAFVYVANWGSRRLMLRFPRRSVDLKTLKRYRGSGGVSVRARGAFVVLEFHSEGDPNDGDEDGSRWSEQLLPLRDEILGGDLRALYLGWLQGVQQHVVDEHREEPHVPTGLAKLSPALDTLRAFLRVDEDLLAVAARGAARRDPRAEQAVVDGYIARLGPSERAAWLRRLSSEQAVRARLELVRKARGAGGEALLAAPARTVGELRTAAGRKPPARTGRTGGAQKRPESLLETVQAFHATSLAGEHYECFAVNSRNSSLKSEGTADWIADCERLFGQCVAAETGPGAVPCVELREALQLMIDLMRRVDQGEEIVFFADEGGSYEVGLDWSKVLPCYFRCLAPSVDAKTYAEEVKSLIEDFVSYAPKPMLAKARAAGSPEQRRALAAPRRQR